MNPKVSASQPEVQRWLAGFLASHAKREDPRVEVSVDTRPAAEGERYGVRFLLEARAVPPRSSPPIELTYREVAEGRTRFAWCAALAHRVRGEVATLIREGTTAHPGGAA